MSVPREARPRATSPEAVLGLLIDCTTWTWFRGPTGARLWRLPGADGAVYTVGRDSCTCPAYEYAPRDKRCKHLYALGVYLLIAADARRRRPPPPPPPKETPDSVV